VRYRVIGKRRRIVLGGEQELRLEGARRGGQRGEREGDGERERHCDARCGHGIVLLKTPLILFRNQALSEACLHCYLRGKRGARTHRLKTARGANRFSKTEQPGRLPS
jgi:hypothetical protein